MSDKDASSHFPASPLLAHLAEPQGGDALPLRGYVGPSPDDTRVFLYSSLDDLSVSIEVARADVVHSVDAPPGLLPGGTILWVRKDAKITHRRTETVEIHKGRLRIRLGVPTLRRPYPKPCQSQCFQCYSQCYRVCISFCG